MYYRKGSYFLLPTKSIPKCGWDNKKPIRINIAQIRIANSWKILFPTYLLFLLLSYTFVDGCSVWSATYLSKWEVLSSYNGTKGWRRYLSYVVAWCPVGPAGGGHLPALQRPTRPHHGGELVWGQPAQATGGWKQGLTHTRIYSPKDERRVLWHGPLLASSKCRNIRINTILVFLIFLIFF